MNKDQQRIEIAEACGWILNPKPHTAKILDWVHVPSGNTSYDPPDYFNDLNAMHEVEQILTDNQKMRFRGELVEMMRPKYGFESACLLAIHATAAQRAEAFLRTLNLWEI